MTQLYETTHRLCVSHERAQATCHTSAHRQRVTRARTDHVSHERAQATSIYKNIEILRRRNHTGIEPLCYITSSMRVTLHGPGANSNIATVRARDVCYIDGTDTTHDVCYIDGTDTTHDVCYIEGTDTTHIPRRFDVQRPAHVQLGTFCANTLRVLLLGNDSCSSVETWTSPVTLGIRNIPVKNILANNAGPTRQSIATLPGPYIVPAARRSQTTAYERHIVTTLHRYIGPQNIRDVRAIVATRAVLSMATTASGPGHGVRLTSSQSRSSHLTAQSAMMRPYAAVHNKRMYDECMR